MCSISFLLNVKFKWLFTENSTDMGLKSRLSSSCQIWHHWHQTSHFCESYNWGEINDNGFWLLKTFVSRTYLLYGYKKQKTTNFMLLFWSFLKFEMLPFTHLCASMEEIKSYGFRTTWGWIFFLFLRELRSLCTENQDEHHSSQPKTHQYSEILYKLG